MSLSDHECGANNLICQLCYNENEVECEHINTGHLCHMSINNQHPWAGVGHHIPRQGSPRQCHRLPICFLTDLTSTIRNKNKRSLIVRRAGLSRVAGSLARSGFEFLAAAVSQRARLQHNTHTWSQKYNKNKVLLVFHNIQMLNVNLVGHRSKHGHSLWQN